MKYFYLTRYRDISKTSAADRRHKQS